MKDIRTLSSSNWFVYDLLLKVTNAKFNRELLEFTNEIGTVDPILNFFDFKDKMSRVPKLRHGTTYSFKRAWGESALYGHAYQLLKYSGLQLNDLIYCPIIEHGIPYGANYDKKRYPKKNSYIFQGRYNQKEWEEKRKSKAYYIGPYIHYADNFYTKEKIDSYKKQNGTSALIFLPHSWETNQIMINVENSLERYQKVVNDSIEHVFVCVYCQDVQMVPEKLVQNKNVTFVSAGYKTDNMFISRLKTILSLADYVFYTSISSSIGYAYYLGKQVVCDISEEELANTYQCFGQAGVNKLLEFKNAFGDGPYFSKEEQKNVVEKYWGLNEIKSPEEIRQMIQNNKKRLLSRFGMTCY